MGSTNWAPLKDYKKNSEAAQAYRDAGKGHVCVKETNICGDTVDDFVRQVGLKTREQLKKEGAPRAAVGAKTAGDGKAAAASTKKGGTAGKKDDTSTAAAADLTPFIPPDLSFFRGRMDQKVAEAEAILSEARSRAGHIVITCVEDFKRVLLRQELLNRTYSNVIGAIASFIGLEASVGSMGASEEYKQAALQEGDKAQRAFVASQPERQYKIDLWSRMDQAAVRLADMASQVFSSTEQEFAQILNMMSQPNNNFVFS